MRTLYLIRHGQPQVQEGRTCGYRSDVPLSESGLRQAEQLRDWARSRDLSAVYTSPLTRCRQTADILAGEYTPVYLEDDLREVDTGAVSELILYYYQGLRMWSRVISFDEKTAENYEKMIRQILRRE